MQLSKPIFTILILVLFLVAPFICTQAIAMTDAHNSMAQCPLVNDTGSLCSMNIMQHINAWGSLFTATTPTIALLFLLLVLSLVISILERFLKNSLSGTALSVIKNRFAFSIFDPLRLAFRRGILHSKCYRPFFGF